MKAIFFDANGVIYYRSQVEKNYYLKKFLQKNNLTTPLEEVFSREIEKIHDLALRGQITQDDYLNAILKSCGVKDLSLLKKAERQLRRTMVILPCFPW